MIWAPRTHMVTMGGRQGDRGSIVRGRTAPQGAHPSTTPRQEWVLIGLAVVLLLGSTAFVIVYKKLEGNIHAISIGDALGNDRPKAVEVEGPAEAAERADHGLGQPRRHQHRRRHPGLSDTTILLHLSADRKRAYGVSIPRDAMVQRPDCKSKDGKGTRARRADRSSTRRTPSAGRRARSTRSRRSPTSASTTSW